MYNLYQHLSKLDQLFLIAGPCVIEKEKLMLKVAERLKEISQELQMTIIYKSSFQKDNRSSLNYYQGPGLKKGLAILEKIKKEFQLPILTDIHYPDQIKQIREIVDIIQIPAYLCMQTQLITKVAQTNKIINLKHGQFIAPENMKYPIQKITHYGNQNILLTERGYSFGYNDLVVDPRSFYILKQLKYPVIFDVTHSIRKYGTPSHQLSGAHKQFLATLARAGVATGIQGLFIEVHPEPQKAFCDAASQLALHKLKDFLKPLLAIHEIVKKDFN